MEEQKPNAIKDCEK